MIFDPEFYRWRYPDIVGTKERAERHFCKHGWGEGRWPCVLFDPEWYWGQRGGDRGCNPVEDYLAEGEGLGISPHPLFDVGYYREQSGDDGAGLVHYLEVGAKMGLSPHLLFDAGFYRARWREGEEGAPEETGDAFSHYLMTGWKAAKSPHWLFSVEWYLSKNPDLPDWEPLGHFVRLGAGEGRSPHPLFAPDWYAERVGVPVGEALRHYLKSGASEGQAPHWLFDPAYYLGQIGEAVSLGGSLRHFLEVGWREGATPLAEFDPDWYRVVNSLGPDVNPVMHYLSSGTRRFLSPSAAFDSKAYAMEYDDVPYSGMDPFHHWLSLGKLEGRLAFSTEKPGLHQSPYAFPQDRLWRADSGTMRAVEDSGLFDAAYYRAMNPDLEEVSEEELLGLWLERGTNEMRNPSARFDSAHYLRSAEGALESGLPTLVHFLEEGRERGAATLPEGGLVLPAGFGNDISGIDASWALHAHVYYPDLAEELAGYVERIVDPVNLLVSVNRKRDLKRVGDLLGRLPNLASLDLRLVPNSGRDQGPLWVGFRDALEEYEFIGHVHTKRSPHCDFGNRWRIYLYEMMMGSPELVRQALGAFEDPEVAVVMPDNWPGVKLGVLAETSKAVTLALMERLGFGSAERDLVSVADGFPAGSMCWFRTAEFRPILDLNLTHADFAREADQLDGTLAHALERAMGVYPRAMGQKVVTLYGLPPDPGALVNAYRRNLDEDPTKWRGWRGRWRRFVR